MIRPLPHIAQMASYQLADLSAAADMRTIQLAQNECFRSPSPLALEAAAKVLGTSNLYPDPDWTGLRETIARIHNLPAADIVCGNGSLDLLGRIAQAYGDGENAILSSKYCYPYFRTIAQFANARFDAAEETGFIVSVDALLACVKPDTRIVFVANPGNPTGTRISGSELRRLHDGLNDHILLVIDEAYGEFSDHLNEPVFDLVKGGRTVVLRTFSKAYALAGARVGWGYFPASIGNEIRKVLNPNNISAVSQSLAATAMEDQAYMLETVNHTRSLRDNFIKKANAIGIKTPESHANFALMEFADQKAAQKAEQALRAKGVLFRAMTANAMPQCLRASIGSQQDMDFALDILVQCQTGDC